MNLKLHIIAVLLWAMASSEGQATFSSVDDSEVCTIVNSLNNGSYAVLCSRIKYFRRQAKSRMYFTFEEEAGKYIAAPSIEVGVDGSILQTNSLVCNRNSHTSNGVGSIMCISVHEIVNKGSMACLIVYSRNNRSPSIACTNTNARISRTEDGSIHRAKSFFCNNIPHRVDSEASVICISGHEISYTESIVCTVVNDLKDRSLSIACTTSHIGVRDTVSFSCNNIQENDQQCPMLSCISVNLPIKGEIYQRSVCNSVYDLSGKAVSIACSNLLSEISNEYSIECSCLQENHGSQSTVSCTSHHKRNNHPDSVLCYAYFNILGHEGILSCHTPVKKPEVKYEVQVRSDSVATSSLWSLAQFAFGKIVKYGVKLAAGYLNIGTAVVDGAIEVYNMFQDGPNKLPYTGLKYLIGQATTKFGFNEKVVNCVTSVWDLYVDVSWDSVSGLISDCIVGIIR